MYIMGVLSIICVDGFVLKIANTVLCFIENTSMYTVSCEKFDHHYGNVLLVLSYHRLYMYTA